jgi:hypothetical protein
MREVVFDAWLTALLDMAACSVAEGASSVVLMDDIGVG